MTEIGEVEYTPTEGERTTQDFEVAPINDPSIFEVLMTGVLRKEKLLRNRVLRTLYCTTKNEPHKRRFRLEVNEQSCDIRPIASEGSVELRYLHSTQNLFDYMLNYGNDTVLYVKLLRGKINSFHLFIKKIIFYMLGDPPSKSVEFDGYMVLKNILIGDQIPICRVESLEVTLVNPNLPIKVKLPIGDPTWRSLPKIRAAELQCMQLTISLLSRHESEMYVTIETEKNSFNFLHSNYNNEERLLTLRRGSDINKKQTEENERRNFDNQLVKPKVEKEIQYEPLRPTKYPINDEKKISKPPTPILSRAMTLSHPASDKLYRDEEKRVKENNLKSERQRSEQDEKTTRTQRTIIRDKPPSSPSFNRHKTKTNII